MRRVLVGILLLLVAGCGAPSRACTLIGAAHGVAVDVVAPAGPVHHLVVRVCSRSRCWTRSVRLTPSPTSSDLVGAAGILDLPAGRLTVRGHYRRAGHVVRFGPQVVRATPNYPNGKACGADGSSARLRIPPA